MKQIVLLAIFFILGAVTGSMYTKIRFLEAGYGRDNKPAVEAAPTQAAAPSEPTTVDVKVTADDPVRGNLNAKLTIVEFGDFECPFCARFYNDVAKPLLSEYINTGMVKFVYKQNPLPFHSDALPAANASLCANEQGKFWEYHDKLFESQDLSLASLKKYATELGLNAAKFNDCLDTKKYNAQVQADIAEANRNGFSGTPSTAVGTVPIVGAQPYSQFKSIIDTELAKL